MSCLAIWPVIPVPTLNAPNPWQQLRHTPHHWGYNEVPDKALTNWAGITLESNSLGSDPRVIMDHRGTELFSPSSLQDSILPRVTRNEIVLSTGDAAVWFTEWCLKNGHERAFPRMNIPPILLLWWISPAHLRGKLLKSEKQSIQSLGAAFTLGTYKSLGGRMPTIGQGTNR